MNYKKLAALLSLSTLASSCSTNIVLEGERKELILQTAALAVDPSIKGEHVALGAQISPANWTMQGYNPTYQIPHVKFSGEFSKVATFNGGKGSEQGKQLIYTPLIQNDRMFTIDTNGHVRCYDLTNQTLVWNKAYVTDERQERTVSVTGMTIEGNMGILSLSTDQGVAIQLDTGDVIWQKKLSDISRIAPRAHGSNVFFSNIDNMLDVRDLKTGERKWTYQSLQEEAMLLAGANITATSNYILAPFASGELVAFNPTGTMVWSDQITSGSAGNIISNIQQIYAPIVVDKHTAFVASHAGSLIAYNLSSGRRIWEQPILTLQTPVLSDGYMFVMDKQQRLMCLKKQSGQVKWIRQLQISEEHFSVSEAPIHWYGPMLMSNHVMVFASNGTVCTLDPTTGDIKHTIKLNHKIAMAPIVVKDKCYLVTPNNYIVVYE